MPPHPTVPRHKTVDIKRGRDTFPIDVKLAPLVRLLWDYGLETRLWCQEEWPGLASIDFYDIDNVMGFLHVAQRDYKVEAISWDNRRDHGKDTRPAISVRLLVMFPTKDIPRLVETFTRAIKADRQRQRREK